MNILFVHLLNNYTGSPQVLANILKELSLRKEFTISLLTSKTDGCLSNISNITYYNNYYKWFNNRFILLFRFIFVQIYIFLFILLKAKGIDIIYINTIVPFSAAIASKLLHKKIVYHVHEVYIHPNILQQIMQYTMKKNADKIIAVSKYVSENINRKSVVIYNTVSRRFELTAKKLIEENVDIINNKFHKKNIVMASSLKKYKGIDIFVSLARKCPEYSFSLIISSSLDDIQSYLLNSQLPDNLHIISLQSDLTSYYFEASIVLNLSIPNMWIETFGMTLIEGFQFGTPCIAPNYGGPKEIIIQGKNGFLIEPDDEDSIIHTIDTILESEGQYKNFVDNVFKLNYRFSFELSIKQLIKEINY